MSHADWKSEFPFTPRFFDLDGHRYSYVDEGQGPVLLCVHGNPTWSFAWRGVISAFRDSHRVIAVDHIGCGRSDKPRDYEYRLARHVENLTRFVDGLGLENITLVAHDWGGCIGMGAAVARPDRFGRFILMNTAAFRSRRIPLRIAVCRIPGFGALAVRGLNGFSRAALTMAVERPLSPAARAGYLAPYDSWAHRIAVHEFVRDIPLSPAHRSYETLAEVEVGLVQFVDRPMLLPWGMRDWCFTPAFLREWRERFPKARTAEFADAGHYIFDDAGDRLIASMREFIDATR
ncbi:MAG: alpha/beta fold hydrolase [Planctomyces sp.]|nr:alpha/beta fold hydrolase [Planctomyces sp.]